PPLAGAATFSNTGAITIPAGAPAVMTGPADPYPSTIDVSGVTGTITKVTVTLNGYSHTSPLDGGALLVGPDRPTNVTLRNGPGPPTAVAGLTLTFDDAAASPPPCGNTDDPLVSGTYQPGDCRPGDSDFPPPAPTGPYGALLSGFNGTNANGTWSLYVNDFVDGDVGS